MFRSLTTKLNKYHKLPDQNHHVEVPLHDFNISLEDDELPVGNYYPPRPASQIYDDYDFQPTIIPKKTNQKKTNKKKTNQKKTNQKKLNQKKTNQKKPNKKKDNKSTYHEENQPYSNNYLDTDHWPYSQPEPKQAEIVHVPKLQKAKKYYIPFQRHLCRCKIRTIYHTKVIIKRRTKIIRQNKVKYLNPNTYLHYF